MKNNKNIIIGIRIYIKRNKLCIFKIKKLNTKNRATKIDDVIFIIATNLAPLTFKKSYISTEGRRAAEHIIKRKNLDSLESASKKSKRIN